jgi:hypothetical protein
LAVNNAGRVLWATLADGATRDELVQALVDAFGIDRSRAGADVDAFTSELVERDLLLQEPVDHEPGPERH